MLKRCLGVFTTIIYVEHILPANTDIINSSHIVCKIFINNSPG